MSGQKLKGQFAPIKAYGRGENAWLLMKLDDEFATKVDITLEDKSVISGQDLKEIASTSENVYGQKPKEKSKPVSEKKVKKPWSNRSIPMTPRFQSRSWTSLLKLLIELLARFQGMPQFGWMSELMPKSILKAPAQIGKPTC